jgi:hypothetical protein
MSYPHGQSDAKERIIMKIRSDSPFAKLTRENEDWLLESAETSTLSDLADEIEKEYGFGTTSTAVHRYLAKLRRERALEAAQDAEETTSALAELGKMSKSREAALELARQKLCDVAVDAKAPEQLAELVKTLSEEKAREHEQTMRERAMALAEENAKTGRRRLELQEARSALRLLPAIVHLVNGSDGTAEERLSKVRELLLVGGGKLLLPEGDELAAKQTGDCGV